MDVDGVVLERSRKSLLCKLKQNRDFLRPPFIGTVRRKKPYHMAAAMLPNGSGWAATLSGLLIDLVNHSRTI